MKQSNRGCPHENTKDIFQVTRIVKVSNHKIIIRVGLNKGGGWELGYMAGRYYITQEWGC